MNLGDDISISRFFNEVLSLTACRAVLGNDGRQSCIGDTGRTVARARDPDSRIQVCPLWPLEEPVKMAIAMQRVTIQPPICMLYSVVNVLMYLVDSILQSGDWCRICQGVGGQSGNLIMMQKPMTTQGLHINEGLSCAILVPTYNLSNLGNFWKSGGEMTLM